MANVFDYYDEKDHLAHYGVLGMRWGVRKDARGAYTKASKKFNRLANKSDEQYLKSQKYSRKAERRKVGSNKREAEIARRSFQRSERYGRKAAKWLNNMEKAFLNQPVVSIDPSYITRGNELIKRYS